MYVISPFRYGVVEEGVYRGSYPSHMNLSFLKRLKLTTLISMVPKKPTGDLTKFCEDHDIKHLHYNVAKGKGDPTITPQTTAEIINIIIDPKNLPVYLHCLDGTSTTGVVVMCLRKLQNWNLSVIVTELKRYSPGSTKTVSEFVESFRAEIDIPANKPNWLWQCVPSARHPSLTIRYPGVVTPSKARLKEKQRETTPPSTGIDSSTRAILTISNDLDALDLHVYPRRQQQRNGRQSTPSGGHHAILQPQRQIQPQQAPPLRYRQVTPGRYTSRTMRYPEDETVKKKLEF
eukprot:TRINITY_DN11106_c0_g1_i1.p1 TRINITY_DN11106_c0_g1~~TRINITY_DN11106_c0_g1_i1.p1  ORF type:complete len:289 (+),score=40.88 TRINITY_DN11106_c0_g1_i1:441-1307(+)